MTYLFDLGRDSELSKAELFCKLDSWEVNYSVRREFSECVFADVDDCNLERLQKEMGGVVRIAEIKEFNELSLNNNDKWGFSSYGISRDEHLKRLSDLKSSFKGFKNSHKWPSRLGKKGLRLSPSDLVRRVDKEFVFAHGFWGETVAFFNPFEQEARDLGRPCHDVSQAVSIRLAKIMVNLSLAERGQKLLDPFCGVGTILGEALLQGVHVVGVDLSRVMVGKSRKNLEWLKKEYGSPNSFEIIQGDSSMLSKVFKGVVDVAVSEPFMGELIRKPLSQRECVRRVDDLSGFYSRVFRELRKVVKKGGRVVFVLPGFRSGNKVFRVAPGFPGFRLVNSFDYGKKDNKLLRQVCVFVNS